MNRRKWKGWGGVGLGLFVLAPTLAASAVLETPSSRDILSGIGVIRGWKCEATGPITVVIDEATTVSMVYGSERVDTVGPCGDSDNGFVAIFNWALLDVGEHTAQAYDNGVPFGDPRTFTSGHLGEEYVRLEGAPPQTSVLDFPSPGEITTLTWNQSTQALEVAPSPLGPAQADQKAHYHFLMGKRYVDSAGNIFEGLPAGRFRALTPLENNTWATWTGTGFFEKGSAPNTYTATSYYDHWGAPTICEAQVTVLSLITLSLTYTCSDGRSGTNTWTLAGELSTPEHWYCRVGQILPPNAVCFHPENEERFLVGSGDFLGQGLYMFIGSESDIRIINQPINGTIITFAARRNPGQDSWTIEDLGE